MARTSAFAEFHDELRSVAGDLLAKDREVGWPVLVEAGWTGLEIPEEFGGAGPELRRDAVICEEIGRAAASTGYLGMVLAVGALQASMPGTLRDELRWPASRPARCGPSWYRAGFQLRGGKSMARRNSCPTHPARTGCWWSPPPTMAHRCSSMPPDCRSPQPVVDETRQLTNGFRRRTRGHRRTRR